MVDSLTQSDVDRIYGRITNQLDLSKITSKSEFRRAIEDNPKTRKWNATLNDFFWDIHTKRSKVLMAVPQITNIPAIPRDKLSSIDKRKQTINIKRDTIVIKSSNRQKSYNRRKGRVWIGEELRFALSLKKDGLTYNQIAEQLNRTSSSVSTKLYRVSKVNQK